MFRKNRYDFAKPVGTANELRDSGVVQNSTLNSRRDVVVNDIQYFRQSASQHNHQLEGETGRNSSSFVVLCAQHDNIVLRSGLPRTQNG